MLKLKLQYFDHLMRKADPLEKEPDAGKDRGQEENGHRVLIKRGPGNRGPTECGTTHEATSGMSS